MAADQTSALDAKLDGILNAVNGIATSSSSQIAQLRVEFAGELRQLNARISTIESKIQSMNNGTTTAPNGEAKPSEGPKVDLSKVRSNSPSPPHSQAGETNGRGADELLTPLAPTAKRKVSNAGFQREKTGTRRVYAKPFVQYNSSGPPSMNTSIDDPAFSHSGVSIFAGRGGIHSSMSFRGGAPQPQAPPASRPAASTSAVLPMLAGKVSPAASSQSDAMQMQLASFSPGGTAGSEAPAEYQITTTSASTSAQFPKTKPVLTNGSFAEAGSVESSPATTPRGSGSPSVTKNSPHGSIRRKSVKFGANENTASFPTFEEMNESNKQIEVAVQEEVRRKRLASMSVGASKKQRADYSKFNESLDPDSLVVSAVDFTYLATTLAFVLVLITSVHPRSFFYVVGRKDVHLATTIISVIVTIFSAIFIWVRSRVRCRRDDQSWILADDVGEIWRLYRSRWFGFDLFLAVPIELIFMGWLPEAGVYIGFRQLLRFVRIASLMSSPNPVASNKTWFRFFTFCAIMVVIGHICACGIWSLMDGPANYADALYWSVATITSVGYGDIPLPKENQRIYAVFTMLLGVLLVSSFTAFTTQYLTKRDAVTVETERQKSMMVALLNHYRVPWEVAREIIAVFPSLLDNSLSVHFRSSVDGLPPFLRDQLQSYVNAAQLRRVPMFHNVTDKVLLSIGRNMHTIFTPAYDYIVYESEVADSLYVILRGIVEVSTTTGDVETVIATLREGEYFGEMALLGNSVRTANVMAVVSSELLVLNTSVLSALIEESEEVRNALFKGFRERHGSAVAQKLTNSTSLGSDPSHTGSHQTNPLMPDGVKPEDGIRAEDGADANFSGPVSQNTSIASDAAAPTAMEALRDLSRMR